MLYIVSFTYNAFQENTYLISNDKKECWIVDPGMYDNSETNHFLQYISDNGLMPKAIINTHAHIDHILGVDAMKQRFNIPFGLHEKDLPVLNSMVSTAAMFGFDVKNQPVADFFIKETGAYKIGDEDMEIRFTPGHSPGSIIFYYPAGKWLIGGDVLFSGSIGRTDLPGGNFDTLINSIQAQLFTLPDDTIVHPGHGPATTIGNEKKYNPFLQG
jgi:hydroxyacylglutathione hydrolase